MSENQSVRELAENPLLLTLLAVMQQNSIELPRRRVKLYDTVTYTLLENRNIAKKLDTVPVVQALKYLGPLAFQMQDANNSLARLQDVMKALTTAIDPEGRHPERTQEEAASFLTRIRARGGLFVLRSGDYFGFMHRTFQEYFAARYILNQIKIKQDDWIEQLVERARRRDALWREPFLLAVAYQSDENEQVADEIIRKLLAHAQNASPDQQLRDLLLAAACLTEAEPLTIETTLETQVAELLLQRYEAAQKAREFDACEMIEQAVSRRLRALHKEDLRAPFLSQLVAWICDRDQPARQKAALTLLTVIAQHIESCPATVFDRLVPLLLAQAGLSAIGRFQPADRVPMSSDFDVADLSFAALSFMGKAGPAGQVLEVLRVHFKAHPEQVRQLARYSLESKTLLTPTVVPLSNENYRQYIAAVKKWITLRDACNANNVTERELDACLDIHQSLLISAEEARYPAGLTIKALLEETSSHPGQSWQQTWQDFLLDQLSHAVYSNYQSIALLSAILFPADQKRLTNLILTEYQSSQSSIRLFAQKFILNISKNLSDLRDLSDLSDLRRYLLVSVVAEQAKRDIPGATTGTQVDLLLILLARILQIQEAQEQGPAVAQEVQGIARFVIDDVLLQNADQVKVVHAALDIIRSLPTRSDSEVAFIQLLAEEKGANPNVQQACADAIRNTPSKEPDVRQALEACEQSHVKVISEAGRKALAG